MIGLDDILAIGALWLGSYLLLRWWERRRRPHRLDYPLAHRCVAAHMDGADSRSALEK